MKKIDDLIGQSEHFLTLLEHVSTLAPIERPVLIIGERGTGKELIAKRLHFLSKRWERPLISLNCAALSEHLIDSELFGHEVGAFSGARGQHKGRFERAEGGSLFLDELATAPSAVQEKLLRVIEYGEYERVGGERSRFADVRLICATNEHLPTLVEQGKFRADLLDRLAFDVVHIPPLRKRQEDVLLLAEYYGLKMCQELNFSYFAGFSPSAQKTLLNYPWPGNVRELRNVVERSIYRHKNESEQVSHIYLDPFTHPWQAAAEPTVPSELKVNFPIQLRAWQQQQEIELVKKALEKGKFNQQQAAKLLGLSYHQLRGLLRKYHL